MKTYAIVVVCNVEGKRSVSDEDGAEFDKMVTNFLEVRGFTVDSIASGAVSTNVMKFDDAFVLFYDIPCEVLEEITDGVELDGKEDERQISITFNFDK